MVCFLPTANAVFTAPIGSIISAFQNKILGWSYFHLIKSILISIRLLADNLLIKAIAHLSRIDKNKSNIIEKQGQGK